MHDTITTPRREGQHSNLSQLRSLLGESQHPYDLRLARLQGWRDEDATRLVDAGWAARSAPLFCAVGALAGGLTGSALALAALAITAAVGTVADNHAVEMIYNAMARRVGRPMLPANRAARRLGCLMGTLFLAAASLAFATGQDAIGTTVSLGFGALALFVATTNICVPSVVFTLLRGADAGTRRSLVDGLRG